MVHKSISKGTATNHSALSCSLSLLFGDISSHPWEALTQGQYLLLKACAQLKALLAFLPTWTNSPSTRDQGIMLLADQS